MPKTLPLNDKTLDAVRDQSIQAVGGEFDAEAPVEMGEFSGRDIHFKVMGQTARERVVHSGQRLITMIMLPTKEFSNADMRAFFESLEPAMDEGLNKAQ